MASKSTDKPRRYIVVARSQDTIKEGYAFANGKRIPFETPVVLSDAQVATIKHQKEPIQVEKSVSVHEIMQQHQVSQTKASEMAKLIAENPDQGGKKIAYVNKYIVYPA